MPSTASPPSATDRAIERILATCDAALQNSASSGWMSGFADACRSLGYLLQSRGQFDDAMVWHTWAIELNPNIAEVFAGLSVLCFQLRQPQALDCLERALALEPDRADAAGHCRLARSFQAQGDVDRAIACYQRAANANPSAAVIHQILGHLLVEQQRWAEAEACYRQAQQHHPDLPWAHRQLARVMQKQGKSEGAIAARRRACELAGWSCFSERGYRFENDWFSRHIPVLNPSTQPYRQQPHVHLLEIGSYEGMAACWFLDQVLTHDTAQLTCIDIEFSAQMQQNLEKTGAAHRVTRITGRPPEQLPTLSPNTYDVVYINDRCHLAGRVRQDATLSWDLLKPGGTMIFAYYGWSNPDDPARDPKVGIDQFLTTVADQSTVTHQGYQVILRKNGVRETPA